MSLHQCLRVCVLLVRVTTSFGLKTPSNVHGSRLSSGDIVKKPGDNVKEYEVQTCLGKGVHGEVWTLNGSDHLLKFQTSPRVSSECLFGKIATQKDSAHFTNCFDHGSAEVWTVEGSDLVLKYKWKGAYTVWQRAAGRKLAEFVAPARVETFKKFFPDLNFVLDFLNQLFQSFDALQKPGTMAPGIGVRQWPEDVQAHNLFASADGLTLIDYGTEKHCCNGPQKCAVVSGFEDVRIEPCKSLNLGQFNFDAGSRMIEIMLRLALKVGLWIEIESEWFKSLHNSSLESLVTELRSSSGPSREMFRNQWCLQNAKVILEMASWVHKKDVQWPPSFMEPVKIALEGVPLRTPIVQEL